MSARWRIYYDDGTAVSDKESSPFDLRPNGVQVVAQAADNAKGFDLTHGASGNVHYFCWIDEGPDKGWYGVDLGGLWDYLLVRNGQPKYVLCGRTMFRSEVFWAIVSRAGKEGLG